MAAVTIRYTWPVFGHPEPGSVVTVERTEIIDAIINQGFAVETTSDFRPSSEVEKSEVTDAE